MDKDWEAIVPLADRLEDEDEGAPLRKQVGAEYGFFVGKMMISIFIQEFYLLMIGLLPSKVLALCRLRLADLEDLVSAGTGDLAELNRINECERCGEPPEEEVAEVTEGPVVVKGRPRSTKRDKKGSVDDDDGDDPMDVDEEEAGPSKVRFC